MRSGSIIPLEVSRAVVHKCSSKQVFLKVSKFHRKTAVVKRLFDKVADHQTGSFIKRRLQRKCFPVKFAKFLKSPFLQNSSGGWLLLKYLIRTLLVLAVRMLYFHPKSITMAAAYLFFLTKIAFWFVTYFFPINEDTLN